MEKDYLKKISSGLMVAVGTFLFLFLAKNNFEPFSKTIALGFESLKNNTSQNTLETELINPNLNIEKLPENIEEGVFDPKNSDGDLVEKDQLKKVPISYHYKRIFSDKLQKTAKSPSLKLQYISSSDNLSWENVQMTKVDKETGEIYFLFKIVENDTEVLVNNYTGKYQLIY